MTDLELDALRATLQLIAFHDGDYATRYTLVADALSLALHAGFEAGVRFDDEDPEWPVVYIELPTGQVSWHLPIHSREWDRHTTEEKYSRVARFIAGA